MTGKITINSITKKSEIEKIGNIKIVDFKKDYILLLKSKKLYKINKQ